MSNLMKHSTGSVADQHTAEASHRSSPSASKLIWIDLDNSPHVPFFAPIIADLEKRGYSVVLTARDAYQVCELADLFRFNYRCVGRHWGKHRALKVFGTCLRTLQLLPVLARQRAALAVSHGSRAQVLASALLGIPSVCILDYEFAQGLALMRPTWLMTPEIIPVSESGRKAPHVLQYPGIKEDVYAPSFRPDPSIKLRLGMDERNLIVVVRPPASEAHYHNPKSDELFVATIEFLVHLPNAQVILLPRNQKQKISLQRFWAEWFAVGKLSIPEHPEDGLNLMWYSDLVISGGGTMNREAAALGIPVYSIFCGEIGAVDRYLSKSGRLVLIGTAEELRTKVVLERWSRPAAPQNIASAALKKIVDDIIRLAESK
jgi:predicted glycosyltransferase